jgi:hypothetical protein
MHQQSKLTMKRLPMNWDLYRSTFYQSHTCGTLGVSGGISVAEEDGKLGVAGAVPGTNKRVSTIT